MELIMRSLIIRITIILIILVVSFGVNSAMCEYLYYDDMVLVNGGCDGCDDDSPCNETGYECNRLKSCGNGGDPTWLYCVCEKYLGGGQYSYVHEWCSICEE